MLKALAQRCVLELRLFFTALQFFTRVPVPAWVGFEPAWLTRCVRYFPLVGGLVGLWGAVVLGVASLWWPPSVAVVLSMAATVWLTGAFHEDGWADTCDGLGGHVSREKALVIMKDSRLGSYGALGLVLLLLLKFAVMSALLTPAVPDLAQASRGGIHQVLLGWAALGLIWAHAVSRLAPVLLIWALPYAGDADHAKAKPLAVQAGFKEVLGAIASAVLVALGLWLALDHLGWPWRTWLRAMAVATMAAMVITLWVARWLRQRLGGFTGDTLGASQQLSEAAALLGWLAVVQPVDWVL
jgi:adenosylcobinamide-GDP ribazoletransferase